MLKASETNPTMTLIPLNRTLNSNHVRFITSADAKREDMKIIKPLIVKEALFRL